MDPNPIRLVTYKKRRAAHRHVQRDDWVRLQGKDCVYKPRREDPGETRPAHTWTSDSQPPGLGAVNVEGAQAVGLWRPVTAAPGNKYNIL